MADYSDTKTLKQLALNQGRFLAARGAYNNMENEPDDKEATDRLRRCKGLIQSLIAENEALNHRCHQLALMAPQKDPADTLFGSADETAGKSMQQAQEEGAKAFGAGKSESDCPYDDGDILRDEWLGGFREAKEGFEGGEA